MKTNTFKTSFVFALLAGAAVAAEAQTTMEWMALQGTRQNDLAGAQPVASDAARTLPGVSREAVAFAYALPADQALQAPAPFVAESREYWMEVSGAQLRSGAPIAVTAPGALVRINPTGKAQVEGRAAGLTLEPSALEL